MINSYFLKAMAKELNLMFWDFRCYFMHNGGNSISFDLQFFKLVKNSEIIFFDDRVRDEGWLLSFKKIELNQHLYARTAEEGIFKRIIMQFFFLRKEFFKLKRGEKTPYNFIFYLERMIDVAKTYGNIEELDHIKREVIWSQTNDRSGINMCRPYPSLGSEFQTALRTVRSFRAGAKRGRDQFTIFLISLFKEFQIKQKRLPTNKEVERLIELAVGQGFIHSYDDEIEWGERGRTKATTLPNRLVEVRKILQQKKSR